MQFPLAIVERTYIASLEPSGDAVEMEGVLGGQSWLFGGEREEDDQHTLQIPQAALHSSLVAET